MKLDDPEQFTDVDKAVLRLPFVNAMKQAANSIDGLQIRRQALIDEYVPGLIAAVNDRNSDPIRVLDTFVVQVGAGRPGSVVADPNDDNGIVFLPDTKNNPPAFLDLIDEMLGMVVAASTRPLQLAPSRVALPTGDPAFT